MTDQEIKETELQATTAMNNFYSKSKADRYPNGYTPKIEYYQAQLSIAVDSKDLDQIKYFTKKLEWFMNRQAQRTKS